MSMIYDDQFGTEIPLFDYTDAEKEHIGPMLKQWFNEVMMQYVDKKVMIIYNINGKIKRQPLRTEFNRLVHMFDGDYLFNVLELEYNVINNNDDDASVYLSWLDCLSFEWIDENAEKPKGRRSVYNDGFFLRRLSGLYKYLAPFLRNYQIYDSHLDEKGKTKPDCLVPCFIYSLQQLGVNDEVCDSVLSYLNYSCKISVNDFSKISDLFSFRIHLRIFNDTKSKIYQANNNNDGWYGPSNGKVIHLDQYLDHIFIDEKLPMTLFAINHFNEIWEYCSKREWDVSKMLNVVRFRNGRPEVQSKRAIIKSLNIIVAIHQSGVFEYLKTTEEDVQKTDTFIHELIKGKAKPHIVMIGTETKRIEYKSLGQELEGEIFYGDFETRKKPKYTLKNVSHEAVTFMLCIHDRYGNDKCTFTGHNCVEDALRYLSDKSLVYFHNFVFNGQFFMKYGNVVMFKKESKNMSMQAIYNGKTINFRDSYSIFSKDLKQITLAFPEAFKGTDIKKDVFTYDYYTYDRIYNSDIIGNIIDTTNEGHLSPSDAQQFMENIKMTNLSIDDEHFDMIKYRDFYCTQDVNVLHVGFNAFREAALADPIHLDVFDFISLPALENAYM